MNRIYFRTARVPGAALLLAVAGCASTTPNLDEHFGDTVSLVKAQQTLNPAAAHNADPVKGLDGKAAKSAYDEYQKSYKTPEPQPNVFNIGVGSGK